MARHGDKSSPFGDVQPPPLRGRRWQDWVEEDGHMTRLDAARRVALATWPFVASLAAVALLLAATVVSARAIRDRDRLAEIARTNAALLAELEPCDPGDPPESPACRRSARGAAAINAAIARIADETEVALARGLAAHDANATRQHDALRARLGVTRPLPPPTPITAPPRPAPTVAPPTTAAPAPSPVPAPRAAGTTTTTRPKRTCPTLPNGRCRP